jgi:hypothetical protein
VISAGQWRAGKGYLRTHKMRGHFNANGKHQ